MWLRVDRVAAYEQTETAPSRRRLQAALSCVEGE